MKKPSALSYQLSAILRRSLSCRLTGSPVHRLTAYGSLLTIFALLIADSAWAQQTAGQAATSQITDVACGVIGLVDGIVGKMLAFIFLAAGAIAAFAGKWAYVMGGIGGGLLLIIGPKILAAAFDTAQACP